MMGLFGYAIVDREPLQLDVIRDRGALYTNTSDGKVQNTYSAKVMNMAQASHHFTIKVEGLEGAELTGKTEIRLKEGEVGTLPLNVKTIPWELKTSRTDIKFTITRDDGLEASEESRFIGPAGR